MSSTPNTGVQRMSLRATPDAESFAVGNGGRPVKPTLLAVGAFALLFVVACQRQRSPGPPVAVKNPDYLVVRSLRREADSDHSIRVDLPYAGSGYAFASREKLLDLNDFVLADIRLMTEDIEGKPLDRPSLLIPLKPAGRQRFGAWTTENVGQKAGIFLSGKIIEAPEIRSRIDGPIPVSGIPVEMGAGNVLKTLQRGGS